MEAPREGTKLTFPDGSTQVWSWDSSLKHQSGEALGEIMRLIIKPTPTLVEVVEVPTLIEEGKD